MNREPLLRLENFTKRFGEKLVHNGTTFDVYQDEVVGLIGGSGSGKSVLLRALIGLEPPDAGKIYYRGKDITNFTEQQWFEVRTKVAYAFQYGALFDSLTVEENLLYPLDAHTKLSRAEKQKKIDAVLELLGIPGTNHLLPSSLSGGMQKRAGLARSLILEPDVILYDEPTAGLDPFNTINIQRIILDLKLRGKAGVLVTHDMPTAFAVCDRLCLLAGKKVATEGLIAEMQKGNEMMKSFVSGEIDSGKA